MHWVSIAGLFFAFFVSSFLLTKGLAGALARARVLDIPNDRSSHTRPTPRGGGLAVIAVVVAGLGVLLLFDMIPLERALVLAGLTLFLTLVSWLDDVRSLGPLVRLGAHIIAVLLALWFNLVSGPFLAGFVPQGVELILIALGWVWFINLFNFMDGIDGIAAGETLAITLGGSGLLWINGSGGDLVIVCLLIATAVLGFLPHNWQPAKIFLGDVGSVPLGFLCAWVLLALAEQGLQIEALILSLVFLSDATLTLLKRLLHGEKVWQAHRQHYYQRAIQRGASHARTTGAAMTANIALIALAFASFHGFRAEALIGALGTISCLFLFYLKAPVQPATGTREP